MVDSLSPTLEAGHGVACGSLTTSYCVMVDSLKDCTLHDYDLNNWESSIDSTVDHMSSGYKVNY